MVSWAFDHNGELLGVLTKMGNQEKDFNNTQASLKGIPSSLCDPWAVEFNLVTTAVIVAGNRALWGSCWRIVKANRSCSVYTRTGLISADRPTMALCH